MVHLLSWEEKQIVFNARGGKCTTKARRAVRAPGSLLILFLLSWEIGVLEYNLIQLSLFRNRIVLLYLLQ